MASQNLLENSELFETYEADFKVSFNEAQQKLDAIKNAEGAQRQQAMKDVERATDECMEIIDQLTIEVQNLPNNQRSSNNSKIRTFRNDIENIKKQLKSFQDDADRFELFGSQSNTKSQQRSQLLKSNAALERTSERLRESSRIASETEQVGSNIMLDLRAQREQLTNTRNTLFEADGYVDKSIQTLKSMSRRLVANKFISYAIIGVLIILIFLVIASKFW